MAKQELVGLCGLAPSMEANFESGLRIPQADTAVLMAQVFEISVEELLGVDDSEVEFEKARAIDDMGRLFGKSSAFHTDTGTCDELKNAGATHIADTPAPQCRIYPESHKTHLLQNVR